MGLAFASGNFFATADSGPWALAPPMGACSGEVGRAACLAGFTPIIARDPGIFVHVADCWFASSSAESSFASRGVVSLAGCSALLGPTLFDAVFIAGAGGRTRVACSVVISASATGPAAFDAATPASALTTPVGLAFASGCFFATADRGAEAFVVPCAGATDGAGTEDRAVGALAGVHRANGFSASFALSSVFSRVAAGVGIFACESF